MPKPEIICIGCPLGCRVTLKIGLDSAIEEFAGNQCREGKKYATAEFQNPVRVFTTTVLTEGGNRPLLPVRTDRPVPGFYLNELMHITAKIKVRLPIKIGQEIVYNILGTGANLRSTGTLLI